MGFCPVEAEHLHEIPTLIGETNEKVDTSTTSVEREGCTSNNCGSWATRST